MAKARRPQQRPQPQRAVSGGANDANGANVSQQSSAAKPSKPPTVASRAAGSSRLASMRERTGTAAGTARGGPQQGRYAQPPWWRRNLGALLTVGAVVALVIAFLIAAQIQNRQASIGIGDPVPASVLKDVTSVSPTIAAKVGPGTAQNVFQATPKGTAPLTTNGKPEVVYVGADWCPYCAATRWSTVVALSRFGSFSGLTLMKSSSNDTLPNTSTFSFQHATYTSPYIGFNATETADRNGNKLATPPPAATSALATYDVPPYTTQAGGVPFMSYGNQYVTTSGLFVPTMLQGLTWQQIASDLNNPNSDVTKAIVGGANYQTATICALTNNQPGSVCNATEIQQIEAKLPQPK